MEKKPTPRAVALLPVAVFLVLYLVLGIIQEYVLKEHGLKVSNLYISQVKRKCGIEVGENLRDATRRIDCLQDNSTTAANHEKLVSHGLPKSADSRQPQCPAVKEKTIRDALEHFGMV